MDLDFGLGHEVICIKEYENMKTGHRYRITGIGDLSMIGSVGKTGRGFCLSGYSYYTKEKISETKMYYLTIDEMDKHFLSLSQERLSYERDKKIKEILNIGFALRFIFSISHMENLISLLKIEEVIYF